MAVQRFNRFGGVLPRYDATLLRENMAASAENVKLWHGRLEPFRRPAPRETADVGCVRTMHRFGCCWLAWDDPCVEVAEWLPTCERVYVTGAAAYPIVAEMPDDGCAMDWKRVGLPVPADAPTAIALDTAKPEFTTSSRAYVYCYLNSFGEEGAPSYPSDELLDCAEGGRVQVYIPAPPAGWDIAGIRLYRLAEGFNDGTQAAAPTTTAYLFVADLPPTAQQYVDAATSDTLGEPMLSEQCTPPPYDLENITQLPDGVLAASRGNEVWFCEPYQPQAWPIDYVLALDDHVKALKWQGGVLYAMTDGHPYAIAEDCADGQCCRKVFRFPKPAPIVSRKSAVQTPGGVVYASLTGLVLLSGQSINQITGPWYASDDWQALLPHTMVGAIIEGQYAAFTCKSGFLFDLRDGTENDGAQNNDLMPLTLTPNALHTGRDGKLYLAFGNIIHEWDAGAEFIPYRWRSFTLAAPGQMNFAAAKCTFADYPWPRMAPFGVQLRFITDGRVVYGRELKHSNPVRLPSQQRRLDFALEVEGVETVREIKFGTSVADLAT
ncbi:hypothetical protein AWB76_03287 [Caballeronia temeraria]|uniref:Uncharacterized protein n=1 Tax=Caballeronia temeraria TaxID=1777137 RepID=A0A158AY02_9BURK|nr:hypothetical protein [Caballeronia temeraria]SAK62655.1 hypothetical protein AWB76_03287 [Caballeronia temeraria]